jgi:hypothetical protein
METWANGLDIYEALGISPGYRRYYHICHLRVGARDFAYVVRQVDPPREQSSGDNVSTATTPRRSPSGKDVEGWLAIAQAFAGRPGSGRVP